MGVYLSSPVRDKVSVDAELQQLRYGASSMQGWRMYQEVAYLAAIFFVHAGCRHV